jgi:hypothetical protein
MDSRLRGNGRDGRLNILYQIFGKTGLILFENKYIINVYVLFCLRIQYEFGAYA